MRTYKKRSNAQAYLEQVERIDTIINNKLIERQQWRDKALHITANMDADKVHGTGTQSKMEDALIKCAGVEEEIDAYVDKLIEVKREVLQTIEQLYSPTEYNVLHMRYIQLMDLQQIADRYGKEYGWATTTHGRALKSLEKLLEKQSL